MDEKDTFVVKDVIFYQPEYISLNIKYDYSDVDINRLLNSNNDIISFISGISIGSNDLQGKNILSRNLIIDFFQGKLFSNEKLNNMIKRIKRLEICGNLINIPDEIDDVVKCTFSKQQLNNRVYKNLLNLYSEADSFLEALSSSICVDLMPGLDDISNSLFPQSPINKIMVEKAYSTKNLNLVSNPNKFIIDNINFLITSGQNISNIKQYTNISDDSIEIMKKTLEWAHLAPSAPDTLR